MIETKKSLAIIILSALLGCQGGGGNSNSGSLTDKNKYSLKINLSEPKDKRTQIYGYSLNYTINCSSEWIFAGYLFPSDCKNGKCSKIFGPFEIENIYSFYAKTVDIYRNESKPSEIKAYQFSNGKLIEYNCDKKKL